MGLVTSIGNDRGTVTRNLLELRHGIERHPELQGEDSPVKIAGTVKEFEVSSPDPEDWEYLEKYRVPRAVLAVSPLTPLRLVFPQPSHRGRLLSEEDLHDPDAGSTLLRRIDAFHPQALRENGPAGRDGMQPLAIVASIAGTLTFNLVAALGIRGSSTGLVSACASSGHALGMALDEIRLGRQKRMLVVGAEDCNFESIVPFCGMRALSLDTDPDRASRPFDKTRNGFVGTGGAVSLVLETKSEAQRRGAEPYAKFIGWGQGSDGHNVAISHPEGRGLKRAMTQALADAGLFPPDIDYLNAHAPSTSIGDASELKAIKSLFPPPQELKISSTKALTGHGLSLSSIMEASFCCLALKDGFLPGSAHVSEPDPEIEHLRLLRQSEQTQAARILSNSSGFGGANVSVIFEQAG